MKHALLLLLATTASGCEPDFLPCGTTGPGSTTSRRCANPNEVCICAWASCAVPVYIPDSCDSRYRFTNDEFADPYVRGRCVDEELTGWRVEPGSTQTCEALRGDAGVDAGIDAPIDAPPDLPPDMAPAPPDMPVSPVDMPPIIDATPDMP